MQSFWQVTGTWKWFFHRRHTRHVSYAGNHIIFWIHSELFHLMSSLNRAEVKVTDIITLKCCDHLVFEALCYASRWSLCGQVSTSQKLHSVFSEVFIVMIHEEANSGKRLGILILYPQTSGSRLKNVISSIFSFCLIFYMEVFKWNILNQPMGKQMRGPLAILCWAGRATKNLQGDVTAFAVCFDYPGGDMCSQEHY